MRTFLGGLLLEKWIRAVDKKNRANVAKIIRLSLTLFKMSDVR
jgi:hypothetical protein